MRFQNPILAAFAVFFFFTAASHAEVQNSLTISAPTLYPGDSGSYTASSTSGASASAIGTKTFTYSGLMKYDLGFGDGRFTGSVGASRYGIAFDDFEIFQSFLTPIFHTSIVSTTTCPSGAKTYRWLGVRFRNKNLTRGAQDPTATNFYAGGTLTYDSTASPVSSLTNYFDLVGPTSHAGTSGINPNSSEPPKGGCSDGTFKTASISGGMSPTPFDEYGRMYFGTNAMTYIGSGGNPLVMVGFLSQTVDASTFSGINQHTFSGIYTSYDWPGTQTRKNIFLVPDALGTTFTLRTSTSDSDPTQYTTLGTLACTSVGTPSAGFCSGTLTLNGVSGSGNAVCTLSTLGSPILACAAQRPDVNTVPVSILAAVPTRAILSVTTSPAVAQVATVNGVNSATITATLTNLSGRAIPSLANPGGGLDLTAPFSNSGAYAGTGGTCGSSLAGYASCNVTITYLPTVVGASSQTFRVAYNNGSSTVNATATVTGAGGLSSISIDQARPGYAPNSAQNFTATGVFTGGVTQDISNLVTWASSNTSALTVSSTGAGNFYQVGSSNLSATFGSSSDTLSTSVLDPSAYFTVLGQTATTTVQQATTGSLHGPYGVASAGTKLFVAEAGNHRVSVWNTIPTTYGQAASFSLCQGSFDKVTANEGGIAANRCFEPYAVATDGTRLAVAETSNNRVLLWNSLPTVQGQAADIVLGQPSFTSSNFYLSDRGFSSYVTGVFVGSSRLLVSDPNNGRVMVWNSIPTVNYQPASFALGVADFNTAGGGLAANKLDQPRGIYSDGTRVYIADQNNNRVLVWTTFPTMHGQGAVAALGQASRSAGSCNRGGSPASDTLCAPTGVWGDGTKLYVADSGNNRVLIWNTYPSTNGKAADIVVGQASFSSTNGGATPDTLSFPSALTVNGTKLIVADPFNSRVAVYNTVPTVNGTAGSYYLGQRDGYTYFINDNQYVTPTSQTFSTPKHIHSDGKRFFVGDWGNNRVLIWNSFPSGTNPAPDLVLGQNSFTTNSQGLSSTAYDQSLSVWSTGKKLLVSDFANSRVLIWNSMPTVNNQAPSLVLGQSNFTTNTATTAANRMSYPFGVWSDGTRVLVADGGNHRVLLWNTFPTVNAQPADRVIGQPNMTTSASGTSATTMNWPSKAIIVGNRVFVADSSNARILAWNSVPTTDGKAADYVLGQADLNSAVASACGSCLYSPEDVFSDGTRLMAVGYSRAIIWNTIPTTTNQVFDSIIGQLSTEDGFYNIGSSGSYTNPTGTFVSWPGGIWSDGVYTFISDSGNHRIVPVSPASSYYASLSISGGPTYAYGSGNVGNTITAPAFTVSNSGATIANDLAVGTALAAPFYYKGGSYPGTGGTCGTSLAGGASCTLVVSFLPTVSGTWSGTPLELKYRKGDGGGYQTTSISLSGSVTKSALTISDGPTYNFGTVATSATKAFTLTNTGGTKTTNMWSNGAPGAPYTFYGGTYPGTGGTCTTQLNGGATCTVVVQFAPTSTGTFNGTVGIAYKDSDNASQTVSVGVTGTK